MLLTVHLHAWLSSVVGLRLPCMLSLSRMCSLAPQARHLTVTPAPQCSPQHEQQPLTGGADLGDAQQAFIRSADTFFLGSAFCTSPPASGSPPFLSTSAVIHHCFSGSCYDGEEAAASSGLSDGASYIGCDVSHRSGPPGFVRVTGSSSLMWPDYVGNWFFNSLGASAPGHAQPLGPHNCMARQHHQSDRRNVLQVMMPNTAQLLHALQATSWQTAK